MARVAVGNLRRTAGTGGTCRLPRTHQAPDSADRASSRVEFHGVVGRRGGKSRSMAILASYIAGCRDHRSVLAPGERGEIMILAQTKDQAARSFNFVCGAFSASKALRGLVESRTADTLSLASGIDIIVRPASFRSTRGGTSIAIICDEIAFWRSDESANPDEEVLRALRPSLLTTKGPLISISSPYSRRGELWKAYSRHFGKDYASWLLRRLPGKCFRASTWPTLTSKRPTIR
jgi:hypothetical protein